MSHWTFALVSLNLHHSISSSVIRSIYQKFREVDLLDKKKTVTALQAGEDRAILLGLGMILSSFMMYFVLGITILRYYAERYKRMALCMFFKVLHSSKCYNCNRNALFL